jgi:hypothetical protein
VAYFERNGNEGEFVEKKKRRNKRKNHILLVNRHNNSIFSPITINQSLAILGETN